MTFEQRFKALKPNTKDSQNDWEDVKASSEGEPEDVWQDEYEHFIKRYPESVVKEDKPEPKPENKPEPKAKRVIIIPKPEFMRKKEEQKAKEKQKLEKKSTNYIIPQEAVDKIKAKKPVEKAEIQKETEIKEPFFHGKGTFEKVQTNKPTQAIVKVNQPIEKKEEQQQLKRVFVDLSNSDEIVKHTFLLGKKGEEYRLHKVPTQARKETPQTVQKATKAIDLQMDKTIGKTTNLTQKVIKESKEVTYKDERQKAAKKINNLLMIYGSALNERILKADLNDLKTIEKGLEKIVLHVLNEEDLVKFFENKPMILDAAERVGLVNVKREKNKIISIVHASSDMKAIEKEVAKKEDAVRTFGKGGRL